MPTENTPKIEKQTLFRFVTFRNPQLINESIENEVYAKHPDLTQSNIYEAVKGISDTESRFSELQNQANLFESHAFKSYKEIKDLYPQLSSFALWLKQNKNYLIFSELVAKSSGITELISTEEETIWENLFYQLITNSSESIKELLINIIVANRFYKEFDVFVNIPSTEEDFVDDIKEKFLRLARANVAVPDLIVSIKADKPNNDSSNGFVSGVEYMIKRNEIDIKKFEIREYETLKFFIQQLKDTADKENQIERDKAYKEYLEEYHDLLEQHKEVDPVTGEITYPGFEPPEFEYEDINPLDSEYMEQLLGEDTTQLITDYLSTKRIFNIDHLLETVEKKLTLLYQQILTNNPHEQKAIKIGNVLMEVEGKPSEENVFILTPKLEKNSEGDPIVKSIYVTLFTGNKNVNIERAYLKIFKKEDPEVFVENVSDNTENTGEYSTVELFKSGINFDDYETEEDDIGIEGGIILNNQRIIQFEDLARISEAHLMIGGRGRINQSVGGSVNLPPTENKIFGVTRVGIADFKRVEQTLCCYLPGEVSHIDNIMAREYKERATRNFLQDEIITEESTEREVENQTDTTTTDRFEMQSEIQKALEESKSKDSGVSAGLSAGFGPVSMNLNAFANFSQSSSASESNMQAQNFAQEVTERALERIVTKTSIKRTSRMLREFEENNKHGFDNKEGNEHVTGIYRWVNKEYVNQIVNYGKRLIYEIAVPEPAKNLKNALVLSNANEVAVNSVPKPVLFSELKDVGSIAITHSTYWFFAAAYGAEVSPPPAKNRVIEKSISSSSQVMHGTPHTERLYKADSENIELPEGYYATHAKMVGLVFNDSGGQVQFRIDDVWCSVSSTGSQTNFFQVNNVVENLSVSWLLYYAHTFSANIIVKCELTSEKYAQWQLETYNAIMEAYNQRMKEYNEAVEKMKVSLTEEKLELNPEFNRSIEQIELKRATIELLTKPFGINISQNHYATANNVGIHKINQNQQLDNHAAHVKFFEQAFDWEIMSYLFYPYFYAEESKWFNLIQTTNDSDFIFQSFLQSGMARVMLPVREGFEKAVLYYMETGQIWNGEGIAIDSRNPLYLSIVEELQQPKGTPEGCPWKTTVPTSLTIIQKNAAPLDYEGLPCFNYEKPVDLRCDKPICEDGTQIATGNNLMEGQAQTSTENTIAIIQQVQTSLESVIDKVADIVATMKEGEEEPEE